MTTPKRSLLLASAFAVFAAVFVVAPLPAFSLEPVARVDHHQPAFDPVEPDDAETTETSGAAPVAVRRVHDDDENPELLTTDGETSGTAEAIETTPTTAPSGAEAGGTTSTTDTTNTTELTTTTELATDEAQPTPHQEQGQPRLQGGDAGLQSFTAVGIRVPVSDADGLYLVRTSSAGVWTDWMELTLATGHGPDGVDATDITSDPIWVGEADAYEVNAPDGTTPEVLTVREQLERVEVTDATPTADAGYGGPPINSRASWSARAFKGTPIKADEFKVGIVHHSVSSNSYTSGQVPGILRGIQAFHMDTNGWNDIAYNFAVDRYGSVWEARQGGVDQPIIGGHSKGFNTGSTGVVVLGTFTSSTPPAATVTAVGDLLGWKLHHHGVTPNTSTTFTSLGNPQYPEGTKVNLNTVSGHLDTNPTGCPGAQLYNRLGSIRANAAGDASTLASVGDQVFYDWDSDGLMDAGEPAMAGFDVDLRQDTDGNGSFDRHIGTITSNSEGKYRFGVTPGSYSIGIEAPNYVVTTQQTHTAMLGSGHNNTGKDFGIRSCGSFWDVLCNHTFFDEIQGITDLGIANGYGDGSYRPSQAISRQAMAAFLYRVAGSPGGPFPDPGFSDIQPGHPFYTEISWMKDSGLATGFGDGTYRAFGAVTRQAMAAFLYRLAGSPPGPFPDPGFTDLSNTHAFYQEISWLASSGIAAGYTDGSFRPGSSVTRQAMAAFIARYLFF